MTLLQSPLELLSGNRIFMKNLYVLLLLCVFAFDVNAEENINQGVNEISIGISVSSSGSMGEVSGLHTAIYGNPGYNVKKVRLTDDTLRTEDYAVSLDYYRKIKDDWYLNAGISHSHKKGKPISGTFVVGGYVVDPAPPFTIKGITFNLGPSYRFKLKSNLTPYIGLNATYFNGKITDTNYPQFEVEGMLFGNPNHSGTYGVGGPDTSFKCWGFTPNLGVFFNSGKLKGFGISAKSEFLNCDGDSFRSYRWGYEAENLKNTSYQINYRIAF